MPDEVVEVAADLVGRLVVDGELEADHVGRLGRQERALDLPRHAEVALEPLLEQHLLLHAGGVDGERRPAPRSLASRSTSSWRNARAALST